jgi:hypothetical protein
VISTFAICIASAAFVQGDTTIVLGTAERDLTGDGKPEILTLVGLGRTADSLVVTLSIASVDGTLYRAHIALPSRSKFDKELRASLRMSYHAWLEDVGQSFFADVKFKQPSAYLESLRKSAPLHIDDIPAVIARDRGTPADSARGLAIWTEMVKAGVTIFQFSPGGDTIIAIGWSATDRRFYRLLECC